MFKQVYKSVTNTTGIETIKISDAHGDTAPMAVVSAESTTLTQGDSVNITLGYVGDNAQLFSGNVKQVVRSTPPTKVKITAYGVLIRASDYYIASSNPDNPFSRNNIKAEFLVRDVLELAGLTNYGYESPNFTFGTESTVEVNLTSAYEFCKMVADTLAWHLYGDQNGKVWFVERWDGLMTSDTPDHTIDTTKVLNASRTISTRDLRNRIVVYGRSGIYAEAKASSPHLPSGFYQTTVAGAEWIDTQSMAQGAADKNLDLLNKLGEQVQVKLVGNSDYTTRDIVTFDYTRIGASGDWYVSAMDHTLSSNSGYTTTLTLKK